MMSATGDFVQKLTDLNVLDCEHISRLSWSPDGQWLAYADKCSFSEPPSIFLLSMETLEKKQLTSPPTPYQGDSDPAFSSDGHLLAFARGGDVHLVPIDGGKVHQLTEGNFLIEGLDWTPDDLHVVFASRGNLWQVAASGGALEWLGAGRYGSQPSLARQGRRLAYVQTSYDVNIWHVPLTGDAEATLLVASTQIDGDPRISPDGTRIAFISDRSGRCGLWISKRDGAQPVQLTTFAEDCMQMAFPRWSPDGRYLAFVAYGEGQGDIYVVSTAGGLQHRLTVKASEETMPGWSQDGKWIYFSSNRSGSWQIWKTKIQGGEAVQVTQSGGHVALESWDGQSIYYTKPGQAGLW